MKPFMGYPGGKSRIAKRLIPQISPLLQGASGYCEVFAGGFSFGLQLLEQWRPGVIHLNDLDADLYSLWYMVLHRPEELCEDVLRAPVSPELFYELQRKILGRREFEEGQIRERAIDKLVVTKISFSNLGEMAGSPVGGVGQTGKWKFDVRWKPDLIVKYLMRTHELLRDAFLTRQSFEELLPTIPADTVVFLDPPYYVGGPKCYKHSFSEEQHVLLAELLRDAKFRWFMTYDDCRVVRNLYSWANVSPFRYKYSMSSTNRGGKEHNYGDELLISV